MLGEKIGEETGQTIGRRVLPGDGMPSMEVSFQAQGKVLGMESSDVGTYVATMGPDGLLRGTGQGILMTKDGEGASWKGHGVGKMTKNGGVSWRGSLVYMTMSPKLARLNSIVGLFEYEVDATGKTLGKIWEWK
ncbi:MAG: hypothetical protein HY261_02745 [Chloroflexi bacterium]|nr:hypothetical protein [Chloroflexota bacterium]